MYLFSHERLMRKQERSRTCNSHWTGRLVCGLGGHFVDVVIFFGSFVENDISDSTGHAEVREAG